MSARPPEKDYRLPASRRWPVELRGLLRVDADLDTDVLDRINLIPGIEVISTCAGHLRGAHIGDQVVRGSGPSGAAIRAAARRPLFHQHTSFWLKPTADHRGGSLKWFEQTVTRMERAAADLLASTQLKLALGSEPPG